MKLTSDPHRLSLVMPFEHSLPHRRKGVKSADKESACV